MSLLSSENFEGKNKERIFKKRRIEGQKKSFENFFPKDF
jgi:hypothetical protein